MAKTRGETLKQVTKEYLECLNLQAIPSPDDLVGDILQGCELAIDAENASRPKSKQWKCPDKLIPAQIADILSALYSIANVSCTDEDVDTNYDLLCIYQEDGEKKGTYVADESCIESYARKYNYELTKREAEEVLHILRQNSPRKTRCSERNLIALNNGIFDYDTKQLLSFTPDKVFITKSRVNFNPNAVNVVLHNDEDNTDWDVESWSDDLFDGDAEMADLIWKILGCIIRPNVNWDVSAWFYSSVGCNGKGCLCELMQQLCGKGAFASIPLSDFSKDFMLEPLIKASSIITNENDCGEYIDKAANLKAIITGDTIQLNRKFKMPIVFQFKGFMVQCLNSMPKIKDKTDSFYRRQLFIEFDKSFTGRERKYIKSDYLHRTEVLEYVLYKTLVLMDDYYTLPTPKKCQMALEEYKEYNDPVRQFMAEIMPELVWDLVPFTFLYDLYCAWYNKNYPGQKSMTLNGRKFKIEFLSHLSEYPEWVRTLDSNGKESGTTPSTRMSKAEPLIAKYKLMDWMNPQYISSWDEDKKCIPAVKSTAKFRGILRV